MESWSEKKISGTLFFIPAGDLAQSYHEQLTKQLSSEDVEEMQAEYRKEIASLKSEVAFLQIRLKHFSTNTFCEK